MNTHVTWTKRVFFGITGRKGRTQTGRVSRASVNVTLVVIIVVMILAMIIYPHVSTMIQRSKRSRTAADIRAIGTALGSYLVDSGYFPPSRTSQKWKTAVRQRDTMILAETSIKHVVEGNTTFALDLYRTLSQGQGNLFFSPYSISTALAMTYAGARGETASQMAETLHFTLPQESLHPTFANLAGHFQGIQNAGDVALNIANALWIQQDFDLLEPFVALMTSKYDTGVFQVNFKKAYEEARGRINAWVEEHTNNKIQDLLPQGVLNALTRLVLTNAIYFKGNWAIEFEKTATRDDAFWVTPEQGVTVPMMFQQNTFKYGEHETLQILQMPYKGEELSMLILLPKAKDGLVNLEAQLHAKQLSKWMNQLSVREVLVYLPKFQLTSQFALSGTLQTLGMTDAFLDKVADFSGMTGKKELYISDVIHKAFVEVNEEGTEAAAATAVVGGWFTSYSPQPAIPVFKADHPFLFLIRENSSGSILFLGRLIYMNGPSISYGKDGKKGGEGEFDSDITYFNGQFTGPPTLLGQ